MTVEKKRQREFFRRLGYKSLTPIQEQAIPAITRGGDVLAMARTGSGKTLAFLYPIIEKLKKMTFDLKGIRALVLVPNRELAQQIFKVSTKLTKGTSVRSLLLVGGENIESQYVPLASNPDLIICTPGRIWQLVEIRKANLKMLEIFVLDEADKLLEDKSLWEQTQQIIQHVPSKAQKCLFSATLPRKLEEFTSLHLVNPVSIKIDNDITLSPHLKMTFFYLRSELKESLLINMLKTQLPQGSKTLIYASTKHHVEYLKSLLNKAGLNVCYLYGEMDHGFRKIMMQKFRSSSSGIMVVTDVASRGLDIECLQNVINYDFTGEPKIFVHRVGRVARQNNPGNAYSFLSLTDLPYLYDLSQMLRLDSKEEEFKDRIVWSHVKDDSLVDDTDYVQCALRNDDSLEDLRVVKDRAYKLYCRTRPKPTEGALKNVKNIKEGDLDALFGSKKGQKTSTNAIADMMAAKKIKGSDKMERKKQKNQEKENKNNTFKLSYTRTIK